MAPFPQHPAQIVTFWRGPHLAKSISGGAPTGAYRQTFLKFTTPFIVKPALLPNACLDVYVPALIN